MRVKIVRLVFCALLLLAFLAVGVAILLLVRGPSWGFAENDLLNLLWALPPVVGLALLLSLLIARAVVLPLETMDPERPGEGAVYAELRPVTAALREQRRRVRQLEGTLKRERRNFAAITGNMSESFVLLDKRLNVISRNENAPGILPVPEPGCPDNLNSNGSPGAVRHAAEKALTGQRTELTIQDGERTFYIIAGPVSFEESSTGAVVIALDITEQEQREALRREFSANVSHELKTPLTSISGFAELMRDGLVPPERVPEFAGDICRESRRMISLVEDIIELSRMEEGSQTVETEETDLWALCRETLDSLTAAAESRQIALRLEGESTRIRGVPTALREMIYNLCDNAVKYNVPGGRVTVRVWEKGRDVGLLVEDTGIGIPYAHQSRVFERFYRVDKSHSRLMGGTGLGLSIVKHAAQLHRARLELWSEPGVGTRITVTFPGER